MRCGVTGVTPSNCFQNVFGFGSRCDFWGKERKEIRPLIVGETVADELDQ